MKKKDLKEFIEMAKNECRNPLASGRRSGFASLNDRITLYISRDSSYKDSFYLEYCFDDNDTYLFHTYEGYSNSTKLINEMVNDILEFLPKELNYHGIEL